MNQSERRRMLIQSLLKEDPAYRDIRIPADTDGQRQLLRGLLNVRAPQPGREDFLQVQDAYLQQRAAEKGITSISEGSILAVGKARIPHRRKPVASIMMPPQAVKSAIIDGLINAMIKVAAKNRITKTISWGIKITVMIYPSVEAKIAAVKKSRIDLVSRMVGSPVIPSVKAPKMPVPLAQNRISTAIN